MELRSLDERDRLSRLARIELERHQLQRLAELLAAILPNNAFYTEKYADLPLPPQSLSDLAALPYTFKEELLEPRQNGRLASNQTWPLTRYVRYHQTSGTRGRPLAIVDSFDDWRWWLDCWQFVLDAAGINAGDRVLMAFSFGPFVGFWSAHDALLHRGCLVIPGGGLNSAGRLELARRTGASVLCCTPSYALHLAEVAAEQKTDPAALGIRKLLLAGEPGGSVAGTRARIAALWQAEVFDHAGASEVGPWGIPDPRGGGLFINEADFLCEFLAVETGRAAEEGELAELVLTTLGRAGCPVIRYRTGDLVRPSWRSDAACRFVHLPGGIVGRVDDMVIVRGVNIFPTAIEHIVRSFPEVIEYRATLSLRQGLDELSIEIEDRLEEPARVAAELQLRLGLRVDVCTVPLGSLPRFEGKGKRFVDCR
ncbi:MAG: phenylacetate--CoA ligase family protein [Pirellulales bacterium]|nr:phenylacetate--CoA ligase family protein [Pirellulales bacterium]